MLFSDPTSAQVFVIDSDNGQIVLPSALSACLCPASLLLCLIAQYSQSSPLFHVGPHT